MSWGPTGTPSWEATVNHAIFQSVRLITCKLFPKPNLQTDLKHFYLKHCGGVLRHLGQSANKRLPGACCSLYDPAGRSRATASGKCFSTVRAINQFVGSGRGAGNLLQVQLYHRGLGFSLKGYIIWPSAMAIAKCVKFVCKSS